MKKHKKTLLIDFDGTIHSYSSGWQGPRTINDPPIKGAIEWIDQFITAYCTLPDSICAMALEGNWEVMIYSSRANYFGGIKAMKNWLVKNGLDKRLLEVIKFGKGKPPHQVILDDRALNFTGVFPSFEEVIKFKPWNKK